MEMVPRNPNTAKALALLTDGSTSNEPVRSGVVLHTQDGVLHYYPNIYAANCWAKWFLSLFLSSGLLERVSCLTHGGT